MERVLAMVSVSNLIEKWEKVQFNKVEKISDKELEYICSVTDLKSVLSRLGIETEWSRAIWTGHL